LVKRYLNSLARYTLSPFLYCLYGTGDISQAFCRASAVYGGIFILDRNISEIHVENNICTEIVTQGTAIRTKFVVSNSNHMYTFIESEESAVSRCICFTDRSLVMDYNFINVIVPPDTIGNKYSINLCQVDTSLKVVPPGKFLVYITSRFTDSTKQIYSLLLELLFKTDPNSNEDKPNLLNVSYFTEYRRKKSANTPRNVFIVDDPDESLTFDSAMENAKSIFHQLYPNETFFPEVEEQ